MGVIDENRLKRKNQTQKNPTNPTGDTSVETNKFDIDDKTIKKQQNKK